MFFKNKTDKMRKEILSLLDKKILDISKDIIQHLEQGITSKELQVTLEEMGNVNIDIKDAKSHHFLFETVLKLIAKNFFVYLYSAPGVGKTYMAQSIAKTLQLDFYFSGAILEPYKLIGFKNAKGDYIETDFYQCFKNGGLFLFDEMDASNPEALITINAALANGFLDFPIGRVYAHEKFRLIAAGNTNGIDIASGFSARQQLDLATLDRFIFLKMPYDLKLEEKIAKGYVNGKYYLDKFWAVREIASNERLPLICSTRALILGLRLLSLNYSWKDAFEMTILKTALPKIKDRVYLMLEEMNKPVNQIPTTVQQTTKSVSPSTKTTQRKEKAEKTSEKSK